jgi:hypothetical protein
MMIDSKVAVLLLPAALGPIADGLRTSRPMHFSVSGYANGADHRPLGT